MIEGVETDPAKKKKKEIQAHPDFKVLDLDEWEFKLPQMPREIHLPTFRLRKPVLALDLFNIFLPESLLKSIWDDNKETNPQVWHYGKVQRCSINGGDFVYATLLQFLACQIRITALQNKPKENQKNNDQLRQSYKKARDHFGKLLKGPQFAGFALYEFVGIKIL